MMNLSFKDRIALHYMIATAIILAIVFGVTFFAVKSTVFSNLDNDLSYEAEKHTEEIKMNGDSIQFINKAEWEEREHREIQVSPVFIQLINRTGQLMDKSPNLKEDQLYYKAFDFGGHFNSLLGDKSIRQVQLPIEQDGKIRGYILAAMSSESANLILSKLKNVLILSYLIVLIGLYFISRILAGRSIKPVQEVTETITRITQNNLKERVQLPQNKDEIHELSSGFNSLLERIENALDRERHFTSDASHELRTPLAALRGTLEVLIRKPREQQEYEEKIRFSLSEIEKMTTTLEQLLLLARLDSNFITKDKDLISLPGILDQSLTRFKHQIADKKLKVELVFDQNKPLLVPQYYTTLIIDNILSNAIKYSKNNTALKIDVKETEKAIVCSIKDEGIGINENDLNHIYDSFFRSESLNHKQISGSGLGLSIAKKCADAIQADLRIESTFGQGTTVTITF